MDSTYRDKKALVIDHSSIITKIIKNFLTQAGFDKGNVYVAHDRNQAMMMFGLENFDLITSGMHLKDSNGVDLLKEVRESFDDERKEIPFLIISAEKQEIYQQQIDPYQATGYLRKPFNQEQFGTTIHNILNPADSKIAEASAPPEPTPTLALQWEQSPVEIPLSIIEAFTESTVEAMEQYMAEAVPMCSNGAVELNVYFCAWLYLSDA